MTGLNAVLFNVPNSIGYARLCCLALATYLTQHHALIAFTLHSANLMLDYADGFYARKHMQTTAFGAILDVLLDNLSRGILWVQATGTFGACVIVLEMGTFAFTYKAGGSAWKEGCFKNAPSWVLMVMGSNFKNVTGAFAVVGLMGCPLYFWTRFNFKRFRPGPCKRLILATVIENPIVGAVVVLGRLLAAAVEVWAVQRHFRELLQEDMRARRPGLRSRAVK